MVYDKGNNSTIQLSVELSSTHALLQKSPSFDEVGEVTF